MARAKHTCWLIFDVRQKNMARLKKYVDRDDYYVHDAVRENRKLKNLTFQVSPRAAQIFERYGVREGERIPNRIYNQLLRSGDLYTGGSGAKARDDHVNPELTELRLPPPKLNQLVLELLRRQAIYVFSRVDFADGTGEFEARIGDRRLYDEIVGRHLRKNA